VKEGIALVALAVLTGSCSPNGGVERTIVASVYPLAWAAEQIAGPSWEVADLTPPGVEAHDIELSLEQRRAIEDAAIVLYVDDIGFQPQMEAAVEDAPGEVIGASLEGSAPFVDGDPHFWLNPRGLSDVAEHLAQVLDEIDPGHEPDYLRANGPFHRRLVGLEERYGDGLEQCEYRTMIVTHEAFAYTARTFDLEQFGLAGTTPEAEPSAERLSEARLLIENGEAGAVFYEEHQDAHRIAATVAEDAGVPALPLNTLESRPTAGDYLTVMEDNLESLREGLGCA
jgi:zinc transport system substrate-binding protein